VPESSPDAGVGFHPVVSAPEQAASERVNVRRLAPRSVVFTLLGYHRAL